MHMPMPLSAKRNMSHAIAGAVRVLAFIGACIALAIVLAWVSARLHETPGRLLRTGVDAAA